MKKQLGFVAWCLYVGTVYAANWAFNRYGAIDLGPVVAPAGVLFAGLAFTFRDFTHDALGWRWCLVGVATGALLSFTLGDGRIAVASAAAFGTSEVADLLVYAPIRRRRWLTAVALSNTVGLLVDSVLFLALAFDAWFGDEIFGTPFEEVLAGQIVGKTLMTAAAVVSLAGGRWLVRRWQR